MAAAAPEAARMVEAPPVVPAVVEVPVVEVPVVVAAESRRSTRNGPTTVSRKRRRRAIRS
ncbi:hypothetical protein [Mycobacterium parascrofulaceum]|uniref:hypothetical protein n=1 Tax=Mycobacterium parascrofulaceum TaxID=240125 RepID=UPI000590D144|nr:hypothetical protein [Mycobacterium parascrofulaceum]